ncbi:MAG: MFS transporter [Desulfosalsimonas sp.]
MQDPNEKFPVRIFAVLFFSLFVTITGVGIVVPLLPVYAKDLGAGGIAIAMIFGGFSLSRTIFLPWFGRLSDAKGRKPFLVIGLFCYFVISLAFILAHHVHTLIVARLIQGVASAMIMPVAQAYVGEITPEGKEGLTMGGFNMSVFCGLSIGPLLGGIIRDQLGLNSAFAAMGGLAFIAFCLSLLMLPPVCSERIYELGRAPVRWGLLIRDRMLVSLFSFRMVYTTCIGIVWAFLPVYADARFGLSSSAIGVLVMLGVLVSGIIHIPMGLLADRWNRRFMVIAGGIGVIAAMVLLGRAEGFAGLFLANLVFGIGGGTSMPALMALVVMRGHRLEAMGSVMALITVAHSLGMLLGSFFAGIIMELAGLQYAFFLGAVIMAGGIFQFFRGTYRISTRS